MAVDSPLGNGALEAELLRNVLDTVTHDLGGLSSALALRADVMQRSAPSPAASACGAIANELRSLGGQLREMSAPRGAGAMSPTPMGSLGRWFALISRFGQPLLGRGVTLRGAVDDVHIGAAAAYELTYIVLALLHGVRDGSSPLHTEVIVSSEVRDRTIALRIGVRAGSDQVSMSDGMASVWWNWAVQRAAEAQIGLQAVNGHVELLVELADAVSAHRMISE